MKILSIRLKNLASLAGEHLIDFETEPLASAGLIAIVGKTGAGKSTILDAMCLALFNRIPRLKDSDGKLLDVDGSELLTNSPLTVLRRGTALGFAELCFIAQDQKRYLARWEIKRARENAAGKLQSVQRSLTCLTDGVVIADKSKAVESHIQNITQLTFEQFTRAVLLAQSEVTAFLKARDNERGELLEYLTNSSIFAKIGQLAFEKTRDIANQRKQLESVLGHIEIRSEEEVAELQSQFEKTQLHYQQLETEKNQLKQQQQWFEHQHKLEQDIANKKQQLEQETKVQETLESERQLLKQLETFSAIRPVFFQQQQVQKDQQLLKKNMIQKQQQFADLTTQFEQYKLQYTQAENALAQLQDFEEKYPSELNQLRKLVQEREYIAEEYKKLKSRLQHIDQLKKPLVLEQQRNQEQIAQVQKQYQLIHKQLQRGHRFSNLDNGLNAHIQQLKQFQTQYCQLVETLGDTQQAQIDLDRHRKRQNEINAQYGSSTELEARLHEKLNLKEQLLNHISQFEIFRQKLQDFVQLLQEKIDLTQQLEQTQQQLLQYEQQAKHAESVFKLAKVEREKLQQILQRQRLLHAENIEHLRAELKTGEPCLVCGSTEHPYRDDQTLISKTLYTLQEQQEHQALQHEQTCFQDWQKAQQQWTQSQVKQQQTYLHLQQMIEKEQLQRDEFTQQMVQFNVPHHFDVSSAELQALAQQHYDEQIQNKQRLDQDIQQLQQANKEQLYLTQNIQHITHQLERLQQLHQQIKHISDCLPIDEKSLWLKQPLAHVKDIIIDLEKRLDQLNQSEALLRQIEHLQQQTKLLGAEFENLNQQTIDLSQQQQDITRKGQQNTEQAKQLMQLLTGQSELKASEWLTQHDLQRQHLQQQYQQKKLAFETQRQHFEQQRNELDQLTAQQQHNHKLLEQCQSEISRWLSEHVEYQSNPLDELFAISTMQEQQIRQKLNQADRLLSEINAGLNTLQQQFTEHLQHQPKILKEQLSESIKLNQDNLQQCLELRDQLKVQLELHQQNLAKQKQFAEQIQQIQQQEHRWNKISSLIGDAKGKAFRDLAQQHHLDILLEYANQQLAMLSQRYTLKRLNDSLSLAIIDHDMDGEIRSVSSLSGGESFLTALAISLAIANMASGSMKIESLFIDEGFGTLDASSLHMVMNALDQLQSQGRKVVLISHIQEMHERIPVQIQVQPIGSGSSRIEIVG